MIPPQILIPRREPSELAVGTVRSVGIGVVSVEIRPGLTVVVQGTGFVAGQRVTVALPGGQVAGAQLVSVAAGTAPKIRQVVV